MKILGVPCNMKEVIVTKDNAPDIKFFTATGDFPDGKLVLARFDWPKMPDHKFYIKYDEETMLGTVCIDLTLMGLE